MKYSMKSHQAILSLRPNNSCVAYQQLTWTLSENLWAHIRNKTIHNLVNDLPGYIHSELKNIPR